MFHSCTISIAESSIMYNEKTTLKWKDVICLKRRTLFVYIILLFNSKYIQSFCDFSVKLQHNLVKWKRKQRRKMCPNLERKIQCQTLIAITKLFTLFFFFFSYYFYVQFFVSPPPKEGKYCLLKKAGSEYCTKKHSRIRLHFWRSAKSRLPLHCYYSQVHSHPEW